MIANLLFLIISITIGGAYAQDAPQGPRDSYNQGYEWTRVSPRKLKLLLEQVAQQTQDQRQQARRPVHRRPKSKVMIVQPAEIPADRLLRPTQPELPVAPRARAASVMSAKPSQANPTVQRRLSFE